MDQPHVAWNSMLPAKELPALKAILFADLAQYSRLTATGELAALDLVTRCFSLFKDYCGEHRGDFIKTTGDGVLILFENVSDALDYAVIIQSKLASLAIEYPAAGKFRIGLHMGQVHRHEGDVYGHAVNQAARVQTAAKPGGICVTQEIYHAARSATPYRFRFAGRRALKNIPNTVSIYDLIEPTLAEPEPKTNLVSITVIDGLAIADADGEPVHLRSRFAQAMIGYLVLANGLTEFQDRLATLLWPDRAVTDARNSLTNCLRAVGRAFAGSAKATELRRGNYVSLDPARVAVDVNNIFFELAEGRIDHAFFSRPDWTGAILRGYESISNLFGAWLSVTRHNRRDLEQEALEHLLNRFDVREQITRQAASALLLLEPSHEGAARCLIRHHAANHNVAAARRVFDKLADTLRERYHLEPSNETSALMGSLSAPTQPREPHGKVRHRAPIIAVSSFVAGSEAIAALTSGFRSELIINLSRFRELTVVDLPNSAGNSDADYSLKAECAEFHDDVRLFVSVAESSARRIVWSDSYRLTLDNWLNVQKALVGRIASNLEVYLSHDRLARFMRQLPDDLGAYDAWLQGEHLLSRWSARSEDEAEKLFEQAIAIDVNFSSPYASLASVYNSRQFIRPGSPSRTEAQQAALNFARRAVELDPLDARNHMAVAWSAAMVKRFEQAELHFELATELNPNDPKIIVSAALGLAFMNRLDLATTLLSHALALTAVFPDYQWSHIATTRFLVGDYKGSIEAADRSENVIIDTPGWKAAALVKLNRMDEHRVAVDQLQQAAQAAWAGSHNPSLEDIIVWFLGAFPIRDESVRQDLAAALWTTSL